MAMDIPVGETAPLHTDVILPPPLDFCVIIDPYDEVLELYERRDIITHSLECPELPNLEMQDAYFEQYHGGRISVHVQNIGPGEMVDRDLSIEVRSPDGELLLDPIPFSNVSMSPWDNRVFEVTPISESVRAQMSRGYTVTINPDRAVTETSFENNSFSVGESTRLSIYLSVLEVPISASDAIRIQVDGYVRSGRSRQRQVVDFDISGEDVDWSCDEDLASCHAVFWDYEHWANWFEIWGDEDLQIVISIRHPGTLLESLTTGHIFQPPTWGAGSIHPAHGTCYYYPTRVSGDRSLSAYDWADRQWRIRFDFCRENYSE